MVCCLTVPKHYWTNVDFSLVRFCGIHLRAISHWAPKLLLFVKKIPVLRLLPHLTFIVPGNLKCIPLDINGVYTSACVFFEKRFSVCILNSCQRTSTLNSMLKKSRSIKATTLWYTTISLSCANRKRQAYMRLLFHFALINHSAKTRRSHFQS